MNVFRGGEASGAFFVALGHFVTNVVGLHAAEVNFWVERRSYSHQDSLVAQFPRGRDGEWPSLGKVLSPSLSESITKTLPSAFLHEHAALLAALPYQHGTVRKVSFPSVRRSPSSVVILIQDVHMNADAQAHIGRAVESLIQQKQAGLVLLEGAFAPFNFSPLRHYSRPKTLRKLADFLLQHNRISGPVHAAATCSADIPDFVGVDDEGHYQANVAAYTSSVPQAADNKKWIADRLADLERQKDAEFNPDLRGFDRVVLGYGEGSLLLGDYLRALAKHSKTLPSQILTAHHPHPALGGEGPLRATFPQEAFHYPHLLGFRGVHKSFFAKR